MEYFITQLELLFYHLYTGKKIPFERFFCNPVIPELERPQSRDSGLPKSAKSAEIEDSVIPGLGISWDCNHYYIVLT